jgi:hypothetical protein
VQPVARGYDGACHCGALQYHYDSALPPGQWSVRACRCSFCRLHGALTTSDPAGALVFRAADIGAVQRYRFGARTTDFLICRHCGAYVGACVTGTRSRFGIINLQTLRPVRNDLPAPVRMDYEDESPDARLARREQRWTPLGPDSL